MKKRCVLLLALVGGTGAAAQDLVAVATCDTTVQIVDLPPNSPITSMRMTTPVNVSITPRLPRASDEVFVTVSGWLPCPDYDILDVDIRIEGSDILVDLHWGASPPAPVLASPVHQFGEPSNYLAHVQALSVEVPVSPTAGAQFQKYGVTRSLGTLDPGKYTVLVTNCGPVGGSTSAAFTVVADAGPSTALSIAGHNPWSVLFDWQGLP
jgi:hypothetical protein